MTRLPLTTAVVLCPLLLVAWACGTPDSGERPVNSGSATGGSIEGGAASGSGASASGGAADASSGGTGATGAAPSGGSGNVGPTGGSGNVGPTGGSGNVGPTGGSGNVGPTGGTGAGGLDSTGGATGSAASGGSAGTSGAGATGGTLGTGGAGGAGGAVVSGEWNCSIPSAAVDALDAAVSSWHSTYFEDCGDSACIIDGSRCVSEGVGYGMLITIGAGDQTSFDKLWRYYQNNTNEHGVMHWQTDACGSVTGQNGASDGDLDVAMALILAEARWGGYRADAEALITNIRDWETEECDGRLILRPGDAWGGCSDNNRVNPSYFAPGYYDVFARFVPAQADHWNKMATDARELLQLLQQSDGLFPDWAMLPSAPDGGYGYEACRIPWRLSTDYCITGDATSRALLEGVWGYHGGNVASAATDQNSAFVGSFALAGVTQDADSYNSAVLTWLSASLHDEPYYQATLRVLYLTNAAGLLTY